MEALISRAIYQPLVALPTFYLANLLYNVDYSVTAAVLVLAFGSTFRLLRVFNTAHRLGTAVR